MSNNTPTQPEGTTALVDELVQLRKFLDGSGALLGHYFGDPSMSGAFWWRRYLDVMDLAATALRRTPAISEEAVEAVAKVLYDCEADRSAHADKIFAAARGKPLGQPSIEPYELCADTFRSDARAVITSLSIKAHVIDVERGWLIEGTHLGDVLGPMWWDAKHGFQSDVNRALRFARQVDAETFMREYKTKGTATEHEWHGAALSTPPVTKPDEKGAVPVTGGEEALSEEECFKELRLLYNYRDTDEKQFTRHNMMVAINHGLRQADTALARRTEERNRFAELLRQAAADLRTVGDDYPGSSCHKWCHERADAALGVNPDGSLAAHSPGIREAVLEEALNDIANAFTVGSRQMLIDRAKRALTTTGKDSGGASHD